MLMIANGLRADNHEGSWFEQLALVFSNSKYLSVYLFCVSFCVYAVHSYFCPIQFSPDSEQYVRTARALLNQGNGEFYYFRTLGYPIVLNLCGVTTLNTFYILLTMQLVAAAAIPSLVYSTLKVYPKAAMIAAVVTLLSFSPAFFSNLVMTDQVAMFLRYLLIYIVSTCIFGDRKSCSYVKFLLVGFALYSLRPADALTFLITAAGMLLFRVGDWRKLVASILCFLFLVFVYTKGMDRYAEWYTKMHKINSTSVVGSMTGKMLFFNVYAVGPKLAKKSVIDRLNGPNSKMLVDAIVAWGAANPMGVNSYSIQGGTARPELYSHVKTPEQFAEALIAEQGLFAHSVMWLALDQQIGGYKADRIFMGAAIESYISNPITTLLLYDGVVEFFLSGDVVYNNGQREVWGYHKHRTVESIQKSEINTASSASLNAEIKSSILRLTSETLFFRSFLFFWIVGIKIAAVITCVLYLPATFKISKEMSCMAAVVVVLLAYHAIVAVAFASPHIRYSLPHVPLIIMLAALGVSSFKKAVVKCR